MGKDEQIPFVSLLRLRYERKCVGRAYYFGFTIFVYTRLLGFFGSSALHIFVTPS